MNLEEVRQVLTDLHNTQENLINRLVNWLSNSQPGLAPAAGVSDLRNLLTLYTPNTVVWCLSMNGNTVETIENGEYVINSYQKTNIDAVVQLCSENNIQLILATNPTVPNRQKTGFNKYIKSLGLRYIDFAAAVGATTEGVWNEGLLSTDNVHPTTLGAKVLASQVFIDCPELTIS